MSTQQGSTIPTAPADLQSFGSTLVTSANQLSAAGTAMSGLVQTARLSGLKRAAAAAVATYGAASTEAAAANQAVTTAQARTGQLQVVSQKAATAPPAVASTDWALHGRVYDANLNPQERYTVFMVDAQNNYISDYGYSYTDATGYFLLRHQGASAASSSGAKETGAASKTAAAPQGFVQVCDANANPVFSSTTPFAPVKGKATYQVLTLPASGQSLGDPPAEIRAVAMPPATSKTTKSSKKSVDPGA